MEPVEEPMERTEEEQQRLGQLVDGIPAWKLMKVMRDTVGLKRAGVLLGWALLWGLQGEASGLALRKRLEAEGMTYASAYRAINDFRKIGDALLALPEYSGSGVLGSLRKLAACLAVL